MTIKDFFNSFEENITIFLNEYLTNFNIYNEFSLQHELGIYLRTKCLDAKEYKIEFERNIGFFGINYDDEDICLEQVKKTSELANISDLRKTLKNELKHEIDICVYKGTLETDEFEAYAIELKYPSVKYNLNIKDGKLEYQKTNNGAVPDQMYSFIKDLKFMETLAYKRRITNPNLTIFNKTFSLVLIDSKDLENSRKFYDYNEKWRMDDIYEYFRIKDNKTKPITGPIIKKKKNSEGLKVLYLNNSYQVNWLNWQNNNENIGKYYCFTIEAKERNKDYD